MIALIGFAGTGKSTIGKALSRMFGLPCYDNDELVEKSAGMPIREIFAKFGEDHFRKLEADSIQRLLNAKLTGILVTGGGAPKNADTRATLLEQAFVVHIIVPVEEVLHRLSADHTRPLTHGGDHGRILTLYSEREHLYDFAHAQVSGMDRELAAVMIMASWLNAQKRG